MFMDFYHSKKKKRPYILTCMYKLITDILMRNEYT